MKPSTVWFLSFNVVLISTIVSSSSGSLVIGYYKEKCPLAEEIIKKTVAEAVFQNPGLAAGLIRIHFHDCFVRGCDGSVLLDSTPGNPSEKDSPVNNPSLRGFEVIDKAKAALEAQCPGTVSCADTLAFAARDSSCFASGIEYSVPAGRLDGRVSIKDEVFQNNPFPSFNAEQLRDNFARKGLSLDDMVTLSGAHSIGLSHCSSFSNRLYNFNSTHPQDPSMDPDFVKYLKNLCPKSSLDVSTVPLDSTPRILDNNYYKMLMRHRGILTSDQTLSDSPLTADMVAYNAKNWNAWAVKFGQAMVRMGDIGVITDGDLGEIRKNCRVVNSKY